MKILLNTMLAAAVLSGAKGEDDRPNIIFLMTDDQDRYSLGCYGNPDVKTENLDGLADDGVVFERYYTSTAICMASRATTVTGMYEYKTGCNFDHGNLLKEKWQQSYPVLLREAGYHTAFAGKVGFEICDEPEAKRGSVPRKDFDVWAGTPGQSSYHTKSNEGMKEYAEEYPHSTLSYGAFAQDFIKDSVEVGKPFCLSISFKAPHMPVMPDPRYDDVYKGQTFTKPANFGRENGKHFSEHAMYGRQYKRFKSMGYEARYDAAIARYYQQIYAVDQAVGMIRTTLEEQGVDDNTVIIFTSDHGFMCGAHGYGSKVLPYEESSGAPMIIFDPREKEVTGGQRRDALACNIDIAPTILGLAGIEAPQNMDGKNMMNVYRDDEATNHDSIALINVWGPTEMHALSVLDEDYKYICWAYAGTGPHRDTPLGVVEELYHITDDPIEMKNLVGQKGTEEVLEKMRTLYGKHLDHWKEEAVPFHRYPQYGVAFDRTLSWEKRADHYLKTKWPENRPPN